jgi:glycosyltransferase involved in cell wall biosynthesis
MRVLNVNAMLDPVRGGGTAERTWQVSRYLAKAGVDTTILTTDVGLNNDRLKELGTVRVVALKCLNTRFYIPKVSFSQITDILAGQDIIHLTSHWTILNAFVYFAARALHKPYVVCPAGALSIYGRSKFVKHIYNCVVGHRILRNAAGYIAITANEKTQFEAYRISPERIAVIPNGVQTDNGVASDTAAFRQRFDIDENPLILFVGRLHHIKGPDLLLEAFAGLKERFPAAHLVFAGPDDGMLILLKKMAHQSGLEKRVHFAGYMAGSEKHAAYRTADLLVIPSRQEAMSIVALEAGIIGTPVLLTNQCGFPEIAVIGGGECVDPTSSAIQQSLAALLADRQKLKAMGARLQAYVRTHFTWDMTAAKYIDLYRGILGQKA